MLEQPRGHFPESYSRALLRDNKRDEKKLLNWLLGPTLQPTLVRVSAHASKEWLQVASSVPNKDIGIMTPK